MTFSKKFSLESRRGGGASKDTGFHPTSKSTIRRVVQVKKATQRKSLQGLENTAVERADGFTGFPPNYRRTGSCGSRKGRLHTVVTAKRMIVPITVGSLHWVMSLWHELSEIMQKWRKWFRNALVMQSSNDVHPLCEFDILSTRTLQSYEPRLLSR